MEYAEFDPNIPTPVSDDAMGYSSVLDAMTPNTGPLSLDYYRQKVQEFQQVFNSLDETMRNLYEVGTIAYAAGDSQMIAEYENLYSQAESKLATFRGTAEAINMASQGINSAGVQFPAVQVPFGLGVLPAVPLAAAAAAIAVAVQLIVWAKEFWRTVRELIQRAQYMRVIEMLPEGDRAAALETFRKTEVQAQIAESQANASPVNAIATIGKWGAVAFIGFLAYKAWSNR
jgi:hypothetical protein